MRNLKFPGITRLSIAFLVAGLVFQSCKKDEETVPVYTEFNNAKEFLVEAQEKTILLLDTFESSSHYHLVFESGDTIRLRRFKVSSLALDHPNWNAIVTYSNTEVQNIPFLGGPITILPTDINLNPSGYAPLSAKINLTSLVDGRFKIKVLGKNGPLSDVELFPLDYGKVHTIPIQGLYADLTNTVEISFTNENGIVRTITTVQITTGSIHSGLPDINVPVSTPDQMEPGLNFVSHMAHANPFLPFMFDAFGDIRWTLDYTNHPDLHTLSFQNGMEKLQNGNLYFADEITHTIYEIDFFGKVINSWGIAPYEFHHNIIEKPNGNFILSVDLPGSMHLYGVETIEDYIIEVDRNSGAIVTEWDLKQSLDETRFTLKVDTQDWIHVNAVWYDDSDNSIIISGRTQGIIKLSNDNRVKWIISNHKGWGNARNGDNMNDFLMTPLSSSGIAISDTAVLNGSQQHTDFEWCWYQHASKLTRNGNLTFFDNGSFREFGNTTDVYSRAVEYEIDESAMTVKQVWTYGKNRGAETYSRIISDVDYLSSTDHILFSPGFNVDNGIGKGGRIIEVDYQTKSVVFEAWITSTIRAIAFHRAERMNF